MQMSVDRYGIWAVIYGFLLLRAVTTTDDPVAWHRVMQIGVLPVSLTLSLMALYRHVLSCWSPFQTLWTLLSCWVGRWSVTLAASIALTFLLQRLLPAEWVGLSAIPFVSGSIGATAYLLYRVVMDIAQLLTARDHARQGATP